MTIPYCEPLGIRIPFLEELDYWAFRPGLRPPKVQMPPVESEPIEPLPDPETPLGVGEPEQAGRGEYLYSNWLS